MTPLGAFICKTHEKKLKTFSFFFTILKVNTLKSKSNIVY